MWRNLIYSRANKCVYTLYWAQILVVLYQQIHIATFMHFFASLVWVHKFHVISLID